MISFSIIALFFVMIHYWESIEDFWNLKKHTFFTLISKEK
jgi:hypothetical protein